MAQSLCLKCGIYPQNKRRKVATGQCCNHCPNHGPWCTSTDTKHAAFVDAASAETRQVVPVIAPQTSSVTAETKGAVEANHPLEYSRKARSVSFDTNRTVFANAPKAASVSSGSNPAVGTCASKASSATSSSVEQANTFSANQPPHRRRLIESSQDNSGLLETASHFFQDDCDIVLAVLQDDPSALLNASPHLRTEAKFILQAVKKNGLVLQFVTPEQRLNTRLVLAALKENIFSLEYVPDELWSDQSFVLEALQINTCVLSKVSRSLHENKEFMLSAVTCKPLALQHVGDDLRKDRDFVLGAIKANPIAITCVSDELVNDHELMLRAIHVDIKVLRYVPELCRDANFMVGALSKTPTAWTYVPEGMLNDHAFMLKVLLQTHQDSRDLVARHVPAKLKESLDFIFGAIRHDGCFLKHASDDLRNNIDVALIAVRQNGMALQYVSPALSMNRLVILEAIAQNPNAQEIVSHSSDLANCSSRLVSKELNRERRQEKLRQLSNFNLEVWREVLSHLTVLELFRCASASMLLRREVKRLEPDFLRSFVFLQGMFMGAPGQLYPTSKNQRMPPLNAESLSMASRNLSVFLRSPNIAPNIRQVNLGLAPVTVVRSVAHVLVHLPVLEEVVYPTCGWKRLQETTNFKKMFSNTKPKIRLKGMAGYIGAVRKLRASPVGLMWQGPFQN